MNEARRQQIIHPDQLDQLIERSNWRGLIRLTQHLLSLLILGVLAWQLPAALSWIPWLAYSIVLIFSFCPLHESIHRSAFAHPTLNRLCGMFFGLILLLPPKYFRVFHMAHHRYTQIPGKDPELLTPKPRNRRQFFWLLSGVPYWIAQLKMLCGYAFGRTDEFVSDSRQQELILEARIFVFCYVVLLMLSVVFSATFLFWFWLLPVLVAQPALRLFLFAEHTHCPEVADMFENTRTTQTNPVMQWLCWNMNLHTAHHAYAGVPFFNLADATKLIQQHLKHVDQGYLRVNIAILNRLAEPKGNL